jgi:hypothetical protein
MCLQFGFVIFWQKDFGAKAAHKMLVKLTPGANVIKLFTAVIYELLYQARAFVRGKPLHHGLMFGGRL